MVEPSISETCNMMNLLTNNMTKIKVVGTNLFLPFSWNTFWIF